MDKMPKIKSTHKNNLFLTKIFKKEGNRSMKDLKIESKLYRNLKNKNKTIKRKRITKENNWKKEFNNRKRELKNLSTKSSSKEKNSKSSGSKENCN